MDENTNTTEVPMEQAQTEASAQQAQEDAQAQETQSATHASAPDTATPAQPATQSVTAQAAVSETQSVSSDETHSTLQRQLVTSRAETAAARLGVREERVPYLLKLCELDGIDPASSDSSAQINAELEKVLTALPEMRAPLAATGSAGDHARTATPDAEAADRAAAAKAMGVVLKQ